MKPSTLAILAVLICLAGLSSGQTFIVDALAGPGHHYLDLPQAVAAVPNGAVLRVRPGSYSAFSIVGKKLSIVGDDSKTVRVSPGLAIGPTSAGQDILLAGFTLASGNASQLQLFSAQNLQGCLVLAEILCDIKYAGIKDKFGFDRCANVHILGSTILASTCVDSNIQVCASRILGVNPDLSMQPGSPGLTISGGRLFLADCVVSGAWGSTGMTMFGMPIKNPTAGGDGLVIPRGRLLAVAGKIAGGNGGGWPVQSYPGEKGGHGISMGTFAFVRLDGTELSGGAGGNGNPAGAPGSLCSGQLPGNFIHNLLSQAPRATLEGTPRPNSTVAAVLHSPLGSASLLLAGTWWCHLPLEAYGPGTLFVIPFAVLPGPILPGSGSGRTFIRIPANWPADRAIQVQYLTLEAATGKVWTTNSLLLMFRS